MTTPHPVYFDCDPGVDDALALGYLVASDAVKLVGVGTVFGNTDSATAARNALDWLWLMGSADVPVAVGAAQPLIGSFKGGPTWIHGETGCGDAQLDPSPNMPDKRDAASLLIDLAHEYEGELDIVAVGPQTNLAVALEREPHLPEMIHSVTFMGGAARHPGNISPVAEANVGKDRLASWRVLHAPWPVMMVGLDVTMPGTLEEKHRRALLECGSQSAHQLGIAMDVYFDFHIGVYGRRCSAIHDPLAAAIAAGGIVPLLAPCVTVDVDTSDGVGKGQTICDLRGQYCDYPDQEGAHCRVVLAVPDGVADHLVNVLRLLP